MLKKSSKYFLVALINLTVLTILLALWTDRMELLLNDGVRLFEFLKIIAFTVISLVAMRLAVSFFRRQSITNVKTKIKIASFITLIASSYLYIEYSKKLINNRIVNGHLRIVTAKKIKSAEGNGTQASDLTFQEYREISKRTSFPKISNKATDIKYSFQYDGFLPDYYLEITYNVPKEINIDTSYFQQGDFTRSQIVDLVGDKLKVTYTESEQ